MGGGRPPRDVYNALAYWAPQVVRRYQPGSP